MSYWDTSTLVKLYASEADSAVFQQHALDPLDALHLATALLYGETEIVATDKRMREAAILLKLTLFPT